MDATLIYDITKQGSDRHVQWLIIGLALMQVGLIAYPFIVRRAERYPESRLARNLARTANLSFLQSWFLRHPIAFAILGTIFFGGGLLMISLTYYEHVQQIRHSDYAVWDGRVSSYVFDRVSRGRARAAYDRLTVDGMTFTITCSIPRTIPNPGAPGVCLGLQRGDHIRIGYETFFLGAPARLDNPEPLLIWAERS